MGTKMKSVSVVEPSVSSVPLCVDLDGTLVRTDLLLESLLVLARRSPLLLFLVPLWLLRGRAVLKEEIARRVTVDPAVLPYAGEFLAWLQAQRAQGRALWLCTASNHRLAEPVAEHLGIFAGVLASDATLNLSGERKGAVLVERFGAQGFDYCGDRAADLPVWRRARAGIVCGVARLALRAAEVTTVERSFPSRAGTLRPLVKALRPHQWAKNVLVFLPLLGAHRFGDRGRALATVLAFAAFGVCASSVYVLNDLLDLDADRRHPRKSRRPFASGDLSIRGGLLAFPALLLGAALLSAPLPGRFALTLAAYYGLTLAYSFRLKRILLLDTLTLAGLYTIRLVAGAAAAEVPLSFWLLLLSVFLFLSLALVKRYAELHALLGSGQLQSSGRGYRVEDLPLLQSLGAAAGYLSVLVLALYINHPEIEGLYRRPKAIWAICVLLLYWVSRVWVKAHRGEMHDDPVVFALRDRVSLGLGVLAAIAALVAI